jgi:hypothetical protein
MIWNQEIYLLFAGYQWWTGVGDKEGEVEVLTLGGDSGQLGDWMPSCWIRTWSSNLRFEIRLLLLCTQTLLSHTYIIFATWFIRTLIRRLPNYRSTEYHGSLVPSCTMLLFIGTEYHFLCFCMLISRLNPTKPGSALPIVMVSNHHAYFISQFLWESFVSVSIRGKFYSEISYPLAGKILNFDSGLTSI